MALPGAVRNTHRVFPPFCDGVESVTWASGVSLASTSKNSARAACGKAHETRESPWHMRDE